MNRVRSTQSIEPQATTRSNAPSRKGSASAPEGHVTDPVRPTRVAQHVDRGVDADDLLGQVEEGDATTAPSRTRRRGRGGTRAAGLTISRTPANTSG